MYRLGTSISSEALAPAVGRSVSSSIKVTLSYSGAALSWVLRRPCPGSPVPVSMDTCIDAGLTACGWPPNGWPTAALTGGSRAQLKLVDVVSMCCQPSDVVLFVQVTNTACVSKPPAYLRQRAPRRRRRGEVRALRWCMIPSQCCNSGESSGRASAVRASRLRLECPLGEIETARKEHSAHCTYHRVGLAVAA